MSEAIELYKKDGSAAGVFYCSECRAVFGNEAQAQKCHGELICECGKKVERTYDTKCLDCRDAEWRERERIKEAERFEKATKILPSEYKGGMVYGRDDRYYEDVESAIDDYLEGQEPEYIWACKDVGVVKATTESLYENMLEHMWEDADVNDLNGVDELEAAVAAFNIANESISVWQPDYSTAILIEKTVAAHSQGVGPEGVF
ncbi:MAG TPA: hypothetical protein VFB43_18070 [Terracidiphilus sp.]|nr:hypothetical protein [Terracidiphilus sp.]